MTDVSEAEDTVAALHIGRDAALKVTTIDKPGMSQVTAYTVVVLNTPYTAFLSKSCTCAHTPRPFAAEMSR